MVNQLGKTKLITFPRSGSSLLVRGLYSLLGGNLVYSDHTTEQNMSNCPFVNLEKLEDLDLTEPIDQNMRYIVQYRTAEASLRSWYRQLNPTQEWEEFREEKMKFYDEWVKKWVEGEVNHRIIVTYEGLIKDKVRTIKAVADFMGEVDYKHRIPYLGFWATGENRQRTYKHLRE